MGDEGADNDVKGLINRESELEIEQLNISEVIRFLSLAGTRGQKGLSGSIFST